uniref:Uncharacterized protein n=1 Tax=Rhizophora mucronata TaxID=61149 RepID=A0A2P2L7R8_RHIMU
MILIDKNVKFLCAWRQQLNF